MLEVLILKTRVSMQFIDDTTSPFLEPSVTTSCPVGCCGRPSTPSLCSPGNAPHLPFPCPLLIFLGSSERPQWISTSPPSWSFARALFLSVLVFSTCCSCMSCALVGCHPQEGRDHVCPTYCSIARLWRVHGLWWTFAEQMG